MAHQRKPVLQQLKADYDPMEFDVSTVHLADGRTVKHDIPKAMDGSCYLLYLRIHRNH
jgi:hypothetical protein